jgi:hypothetical protein
MMSDFGYAFGIGIAVVTSASFFFTGKYVGENYTYPEPCISNLHTLSYPMFASGHQEALENTEERTWYAGTPDERVMSSRTWSLELIEYMTTQPDSELTMHVVYGKGLGREDKIYYVPSDCYATKLQSWNGPTLLKYN